MPRLRATTRRLLQRAADRLRRLDEDVSEIRAGDPLAARFAEFGAGSWIAAPRVALRNPASVAIGRDSSFRSYLCIEALAAPGDVVLRFGDRVRVGHNVRFVALNGIEVEDDCGIGHGVTIADSIHEPRGILAGTPPADSPLQPGPPLRIEQGAFIGNNCVLAGGLTIGAHSVIGPNSVVTRDVPPETMVSGNPGRRVPFAADY